MSGAVDAAPDDDDVPSEHLEPYLLYGSTEIVKEVGKRCSYVQSGCLTLARTPDEVASLVKHFEVAHKRG